MASYCDVTRDGGRYSADQFLEMHRQHARRLAQTGSVSRPDNKHQASARRTHTHQLSHRSSSNLQGQRNTAGVLPVHNMSNPDLRQTQECNEHHSGHHRGNKVLTHALPFSSSLGDSLPPNLTRNWAGLLINSRKFLPPLVIDTAALDHEIHHLQDHVVIASFVGGKLDGPVDPWLDDLDKRIYPFHISLYKTRWKWFPLYQIRLQGGGRQSHTSRSAQVYRRGSSLPSLVSLIQSPLPAQPHLPLLVII